MRGCFCVFSNQVGKFLKINKERRGSFYFFIFVGGWFSFFGIGGRVVMGAVKLWYSYFSKWRSLILLVGSSKRYVKTEI